MHIIFGGYGYLGTEWIKICNDYKAEFHIFNSFRFLKVDEAERGMLREFFYMNKERIKSVCIFLGRTFDSAVAKVTGNYTIDTLENCPEINMRDNFLVPLMIAQVASETLPEAPILYFGTGCIYQGHIEDCEAEPNFFGNSYSVVKGKLDMAMRTVPRTYIVRIRLPITTGPTDTRSLLNKLAKYPKIEAGHKESITVPALHFNWLFRQFFVEDRGSRLPQCINLVTDGSTTLYELATEVCPHLIPYAKRKTAYEDTSGKRSHCTLAPVFPADSILCSISECMENLWAKDLLFAITAKGFERLATELNKNMPDVNSKRDATLAMLACRNHETQLKKMIGVRTGIELVEGTKNGTDWNWVQIVDGSKGDVYIIDVAKKLKEEDACTIFSISIGGKEKATYEATKTYEDEDEDGSGGSGAASALPELTIAMTEW